MLNRVGRKALLAGSFLLLLALIAGTYGLRKDAYLLNRSVRLVCLRIWKYEELSLHRGYTYRIHFAEDGYQVSSRPAGRDQAWREVTSYLYEDAVEAAAPGLTILLNNGALVSYQTDEQREKLRSSMILYFFHRDNPSRRRAIMFRQPGEWRAL